MHGKLPRWLGKHRPAERPVRIELGYLVPRLAWIVAHADTAGAAALESMRVLHGACERQAPFIKTPGRNLMFSHVMVGSSDLERSRLFYDAVLGTLAVAPGFLDRHRIFWRSPAGAFAATLPIDGEPATVANGGTVGFACSSAEQVDAWHAAGLQNGGTSCEDPPGIREGATGRLYLAYLRDPDGNKLCALHRLPKA